MLNQITSQETDITKMSKEEIQLFLANLPETAVDSSSPILTTTNQEGFLDDLTLEKIRSYICLSTYEELLDLEEFLDLGLSKVMVSIDADDISLRKRIIYSKDVFKRLLEIVAF